MKSINILTLAILVGTFHLLSTRASAQSLAAKGIRVPQELSEIGDKYDCFFTFEVGLISGDRPNSLEYQTVSANPSLKNLKQELERLRESVPNFSFRADPNSSRIIHIIDARLISEKTYAMDKIVSELDFYGEASELIDAIGKTGIPVSTNEPLIAPGRVVYNLPIKLRAVAKNKPVRDVLTDCVPLKDRGRILWMARTELGKNQTTFVHYLP